MYSNNQSAEAPDRGNRFPELSYLENLNSSQLHAVTHGEGPALVLAGPGSGKTTVIVKRILYLIRNRQIPPEEILVVTFTKDAAMSMQQRFMREAGQFYPVNFGTFHSIFYHILLEADYFRTGRAKEASSGSERASGPVIFTQTQKKSILLSILKDMLSKRGMNYDYDALKGDAEDFLRAIGLYKNTRDVEAAGRCLPDVWKGSFAEVFETYQNRCRRAGGLDFDDMVYECGRMLSENEGQRSCWQERFRYILIDEFQDINPLQYEVVKLLGERHRNLFAVGDDDQAIYGFRGSKPACLRQFAQELGARQIILNANYRSTGEIVAAAERIIAENRDRFEKKCFAAGKLAKATDSITFRCFESRNQELAYLRDVLAETVGCGMDGSSAVLFRTNGNMQQFAVMLRKAGIPFEMKEQSGSLYEHFIAKDIMAYLKLAAGDRSRALFLRVMNRPVRYLSRESLGESGEFDFRRILEWYGRRQQPRDARLMQEIRKLQTQFTAMGNMSPGLAITYLCKAVGYEEYLRNRRDAAEHLEEWLEIVDFLKEDARDYDSAAQWERAWADDRAENTAGSRADPAAGKKIYLMTVHGSKGLEFDRVYIPDCNEKVFPHGRMPDRETVEEERRIFYVGMTRAKKYLEFLCTTGTGERPRLMSRFLNPLVNHSSISSSNSQLSRYSSKASTTFSYSSSSSIKSSFGSSLGSSGFSL